MMKKNLGNILVILLLAGVIFYLNRGWFVNEKVRIVHHAGPGLRFPQFSRPDNSPVLPVFFEFDRKIKLTAVSVVPVNPADTNKNLYPVWQLKAESSPLETKGFAYGAELPGLKLVSPGGVALPLEPGKKYRLLIQAGWMKAQHDFTAEPLAQ